MEGTYTSAERVERDGFLIAFAGEVMTMKEAVERGLVNEERNEQDKPKRTARRTKKEA